MGKIKNYVLLFALIAKAPERVLSLNSSGNLELNGSECARAKKTATSYDAKFDNYLLEYAKKSVQMFALKQGHSLLKDYEIPDNATDMAFVIHNNLVYARWSARSVYVVARNYAFSDDFPNYRGSNIWSQDLLDKYAKFPRIIEDINDEKRFAIIYDYKVIGRIDSARKQVVLFDENLVDEDIVRYLNRMPMFENIAGDNKKLMNRLNAEISKLESQKVLSIEFSSHAPSAKKYLTWNCIDYYEDGYIKQEDEKAGFWLKNDMPVITGWYGNNYRRETWYEPRIEWYVFCDMYPKYSKLPNHPYVVALWSRLKDLRGRLEKRILLDDMVSSIANSQFSRCFIDAGGSDLAKFLESKMKDLSAQERNDLKVARERVNNFVGEEIRRLLEEREMLTKKKVQEAQGKEQASKILYRTSELALNRANLALKDEKVKSDQQSQDLSDVRTELQGTQVKLEQTQKDLQETKEVLGQTQVELQGTKVVLAQTQKDLKETKEELRETKVVLAQTKEDLRLTSKKLDETEAALKKEIAESSQRVQEIIVKERAEADIRLQEAIAKERAEADIRLKDAVAPLRAQLQEMAERLKKAEEEAKAAKEELARVKEEARIAAEARASRANSRRTSAEGTPRAGTTTIRTAQAATNGATETATSSSSRSRTSSDGGNMESGGTLQERIERNARRLEKYARIQEELERRKEQERQEGPSMVGTTGGGSGAASATAVAATVSASALNGADISSFSTVSSSSTPRSQTQIVDGEYIIISDNSNNAA